MGKLKCMLTENNIKNHFITNPEWESVFTKSYPNWTPGDYVDNAKELFEKNGCKFEEDRPFKSEKFKHVVDISLYQDEEFLFSLQVHEETGYEQVIIEAVCHYEVDFSKFKA